MTLIEQIAREYAAAYGEVKAAKINRAEERALHKCTEDLDEEGEHSRFESCPLQRPISEWCEECKAMLPHYDRYNRAVIRRRVSLQKLLRLCKTHE